MMVSRIRSSKLRQLSMKAFGVNVTNSRDIHSYFCQDKRKTHGILQQINLFPDGQQSYATWSYRRYYLKKANLSLVKSICGYSTKASTFTLRNDLFKQYVASLVSECDDLYDKKCTKEERTKLSKLLPAKEVYEEVLHHYEELSELDKLQADEEMRELATEEREACLQRIDELEQKLYKILTPAERMDESDIILEVESGAGGQEAMLFAQSVYEMYIKHAAYRGWEFTPVNSAQSNLGGIRSGSATISGAGVYREMKYEGGVHRVQRIPQTERGGRIHTSTISVAILPQPSEIDIELSEKDLRIETLGGIGPGGQAVQKSQNAVRITHLATGIQCFCFDYRSQAQNKKMAMTLLRTRLYDKKLAEERSMVSSQRKIQVGHKSRSEKIRTYNFPQGRITDHRIGRSLYNIDQFLEGGSPLETLTHELQEEERREQLFELLEEFEQKIAKAHKGKQKK